MRRRLHFILRWLLWATAAIGFLCWLAGWFVFAKLETALYVSFVSTGAVCLLLVALISGFARGEAARRIDGMAFSQLKRMLRIRFSRKTLLWLIVVMAAFFGGIAVQRRETGRVVEVDPILWTANGVG